MFAALIFALAGHAARAHVTSFRNAHPVAWMHQAPVGETPGWTDRAWFNLELNQANVWNREADFLNLDTGRTQTLEADFEQSSAIADFGFSLAPRWAVAFEVPFANRNGGFMDAVIDQFHLLIGSTRFLRNRFGEFGNRMILEDEGVETLSTPRAAGVGSFKIKLKRWVWEWRGETPGACECGFAVSTQIKVPVGSSHDGLSSGGFDGSALAHLGVPIGRESGVWATAAYSRLGASALMKPWPRRRDQQMYEVAADLGLYKHFGLVLQVRTESPLVNAGQLQFLALNSENRAVKYERLSTAWNALVDWRSSQAFGVRWRWGGGQQINLLATEDFGTGNRDGLGNAFYSNNAPDFAFVTQAHFIF